MKHDNDAKVAARSILKKYGIVSPTLDNIVFLIEQYGYDIVDYDARKLNVGSENSPIERNLAKSLACTYSSGDTRTVFFDDRLSITDKKLVASHELGHICLGHIDRSQNYSPAEEYEANEFTHYLLHPDISTRFYCIIKSYRRESLRVLIVLLILLVCILSGIKVVDSFIYCDSYYICDGGEKYHLRNCPYIESSTYSHRMTMEEYNSNEYEPCNVCNPLEEHS